MGKDAAGAEEDERRGEQECGEARGQRRRREQAEQDAPGEKRGESGGDGGVEIVVENDASEELDDGGLDEEGERRVGEWKVAIRKLAERDAGCVFEDIAEIPEHGEVGVLPEDEGGGGEEEECSGEEVGEGAGVAGWA